LLRVLHRDQFELEKLLLKRDQEILSRCIKIDEQGALKVCENPLKLMHKATANAEDSDSGSEEQKSSYLSRVVHAVPTRKRLAIKAGLLSDEYFDAQLQ
jgi:hypothetical protein